MRSLVSGSKIFRAAARILPGGALLGVGVVLAVMAFPAAASSTHDRGHKGSWGHDQQGALRHARRRHRDRPVHARQPARHDRQDHHLRRHRHRDQHAGSQGQDRQRRARIRQPRRLRRQEPVLRRDHRALRQPHRQGHVHARRHDVSPADQQRRQLAARRDHGLRQARLERDDRAARARRSRAEAQLHERRRRGGLPRDAEGRRDLHADEQATT